MAILKLDGGIVYLNTAHMSRVQIERYPGLYEGDPDAGEQLKWWNVGDPENSPTYISSNEGTIRAVERWLDLVDAVDVVQWHKEKLRQEAAEIIRRAKLEQEEEARQKLLAEQAERVAQITAQTKREYPSYFGSHQPYAEYVVYQEAQGKKPESFTYWHENMYAPF